MLNYYILVNPSRSAQITNTSSSFLKDTFFNILIIILACIGVYKCFTWLSLLFESMRQTRVKREKVKSYDIDEGFLRIV